MAAVLVALVSAAPRFRTKLPAYGRELLQARQAGRHPARVWVIFSQDWGRRPPDVPVLCVKPLEWVAGTLEWGLVAGVRVDVVNRDDAESVYPFAAEIARVAAPVYVHSRWPREALDALNSWASGAGRDVPRDVWQRYCDEGQRGPHPAAYLPKWRKLFAPMLADAEREAFATWPDLPGDAVCEDISHAAFCRRGWDQAARTMRWPAWWGEDLERDYRARDAKRFEWEVYQLERRRQQESAA